jgi:hypothetical protein
MMGVFQIAYSGLMIVDWLQPTIAALKNLSYIYAINIKNQNFQTVIASRIDTLNFTSRTTYNINFVLLVPFLIACVLFIVYKFIKM